MWKVLIEKLLFKLIYLVNNHCVKIVRIRSFSGPYYSVSLRIQAEYGKIRTRKTPNTDTFHTMNLIHINELNKRDHRNDFPESITFVVCNTWIIKIYNLHYYSKSKNFALFAFLYFYLHDQGHI